MACIRPATPEETQRFGQQRRGLIQACVVEDEGKVTGYGALMNFLEAQLETSGSRRQRATALRMLMSQAIGVAVSLGAAEVHAFTEDLDFVKVLKKHYGMKEDEEIPLTLEVS